MPYARRLTLDANRKARPPLSNNSPNSRLKSIAECLPTQTSYQVLDHLFLR
jgi:hypothetical protein